MDDGVITVHCSDYRNHPAFAQSDLKLYAKNPRAFYETKIQRLWDRSRSTPSLEFGKIVDAAFFAPERLVEVPREVLSKSGSRTGNAWKQFVKDNPDGFHVLPDTADALSAIRESVRRHPRVERILFEHEKETYVRRHWDCPYTGLERKCELDAWCPKQKIIVDLKTCRDPSPVAFARQIDEFGYHIQGATYTEGQGLYDDVRAYTLIAIRNEPPFDVELYELSAAWLEEGERWNERWMKRMAADLKASTFGPVTQEHTAILSPPPYRSKWDDASLCGDRYDA